MWKNTTIAAGAIAAVMAFQAAPAQADAWIQFNFGGGTGGNVGVGIGSGGGQDNRLTCNEAQSILHYDHGFYDINTVDCQGDKYKFNAWRQGSRYRVSINAYSGELTRVRRR